MQTIQLWRVAESDGSGRTATVVSPMMSEETERLLEELLVHTPNLLGPGLALVGRQLETDGGPLDLLGVDQEGRLVVFELKRGVLTREAVAQVIDYASDLAEMEENRLARLIEQGSGHLGIAAIEDFADWYARERPDAEGPLAAAPQMVLVGLGVDPRARRMVSFLAQRGIEISLLTFHAFSSDGHVWLAKHVEAESTGPKAHPDRQTKAANLKLLGQTTQSFGVTDFIEDVAATVRAGLPAAYQWPGKTSYSFSLQDQTSEGRPTLRACVTIYVDLKHKGDLLLNFTPRAVSAAVDPVKAFIATLPKGSVREPANNQFVAYELRLTPKLWETIGAALQPVLAAVHTGWQAQASAAPQELQEVMATDETTHV